MESNSANTEKILAGYDPVEKAQATAAVVCRDDQRKYYRFRPARFYGGIATADCVGCCLRCLFCWSWLQVIRPESFGRFYSPDEVAGKLITIARRKGLRQMRISGNEPTISREHLIRVLELVPQNMRFILETNGILIGDDPSYAEDLARFGNIYVRISLKGCSKEEFSMLTGASPGGYELQLQAVENLVRLNVNVHPAVMVSFSSPENIQRLRARLKKINKDFEDIEIEELVLYGDVEKRLKRAKITYRKAYPPERIPPEQV
jgi:uncharacterized Fe-S cluster-containing radical SAM superfamily protein